MQNQDKPRVNTSRQHHDHLIFTFYLNIYILRGPVEHMGNIDSIPPISSRLASDSSTFGFSSVFGKGRSCQLYFLKYDFLTVIWDSNFHYIYISKSVMDDFDHFFRKFDNFFNPLPSIRTRPDQCACLIDRLKPNILNFRLFSPVVDSI